MRYINKFILLSATAAVAFAACNKVKDLPHYSNGTAVALSSSVNMISTAPADSGKTVISFSWTNPKYAQDSSLYKYVLEIDSTGRNFSKEDKIIVTGARDTSLTGKQVNNILASLGFVSGVSSSMDVRVTSSYNNNNEAYTSNVLTIKTTPYIVPVTITPSSVNPLTLSIANAASNAITFTWNATQYGTFSFTYALQVDTAGNNFTTPQVFNTDTALAKTFTVEALNSAAILAGVTAGDTKDLEFRVVAFQGSNTVPSVISNVSTIKVTTYLPFLYLWVPGGYQGWAPATAPQLGATSPDVNNFEGYIYVPAGVKDTGFKINNFPDWNHVSYGDAGGGKLSTSGDNLKWPTSASASYYVTANPTALTWSVLPVTWAIIGDATPNGWGGDTPLTYDAVNNVWVINSVPLTAANIKFRANGTWSDPHFPGGNSNLGGSLNELEYNGSNISIGAAGNYKIVLDLSHPLKYTATITKL